MFSMSDLNRVLLNDDLLLIKKNIFTPLSKENIVNYYLTNMHWTQFKRKLLVAENVKFPLLKQPKITSKNEPAKKQTAFGTTNGRFKDFNGRFQKPEFHTRELSYFKNAGVVKVNNEAIVFA